MRKLTVLTLIAVALASQAGCNRGWSRWMCRGDDYWEDDTCVEGAYGGSTILPPSYAPAPTILPGPVTTTPTG